MTSKDPLNHWRPADLKEPVFKRRALLGRQVRQLLLAHPEGLTRTELNDKIPGAGCVTGYLRKAGFARMSPANAKANENRGELWFASEPEPFGNQEPAQ